MVASLGQAAQRLQELEAVHLGHHQVEQDQGGPRGGEPGQRDPAVLGLDDGNALALEAPAHHVAHGGVVVDDQDRPGLAGLASPRTTVSSRFQSTGLVR